MNAPALISPSLMASIPQFYPDSVTIQAATATRGAAGSEIKAWADVSGLTNLSCALSPISVMRDTSTAEIRTALQTYGVITHHLSLQGRYDGITAHMQAVVDATAYDITGVEHDSHDTMTRLWLREVDV